MPIHWKSFSNSTRSFLWKTKQPPSSWSRKAALREVFPWRKKIITDCSSNESGKRKLHTIYFFCVGSNAPFFCGAYHLWIINAIFLIYQTWNTCPKSYFSYYYLQWCLWSVLLENAGLWDRLEETRPIGLGYVLPTFIVSWSTVFGFSIFPCQSKDLRNNRQTEKACPSLNLHCSVRAS